MSIIVKATCEGLIGQTTASGYIIDRVVPFVALPSTHALGRFIRLRSLVTDKSAIAIVLDVGPWNTHDDAYVTGGARPQAESGTDTSGRHTNHAGIDLGARVWAQLGMIDNSEVEWEFIV